MVPNIYLDSYGLNGLCNYGVGHLSIQSGASVLQDAHDIFGDVSGLLEQYQASKATRGAEQGAEEEPDAEEDEAEPEFEDDTAAQQWQINKVRLSLPPNPSLLSARVKEKSQ